MIFGCHGERLRGRQHSPAVQRPIRLTSRPGPAGERERAEPAALLMSWMLLHVKRNEGEEPPARELGIRGCISQGLQEIASIPAKCVRQAYTRTPRPAFPHTQKCGSTVRDSGSYPQQHKSDKCCIGRNYAIWIVPSIKGRHKASMAQGKMQDNFVRQACYT